MNNDLFAKGISPKIFWSIFAAFAVVLLMTMMASYVSIVFLIIAVPIVLIAFYLRGINGGLSKSFIITPIVIALIASTAIVLFGYYLLDGGGPGAIVLVLLMWNPVTWVVEALVALIALMFFLKVAFSKSRVELPPVSDASLTQHP